MPELFKTKIRQVGTSLGLLIPKEVAEQEKIKIDEEVEVALFKRKKLGDIEKMFGIAKGAKPFERDRTDRIDRW